MSKTKATIIIVIVLVGLLILGAAIFIDQWVGKVAEEAVKTIYREEDFNADVFYRAYHPLISNGDIYVYIDIYFYVTDKQRSIHFFVVYRNGEYIYTVPDSEGW